MQFKNIIGQQAVKARLIQSVLDNRISHAQLFFGSEGSGNLALAVAYAQFICCTKKQKNDSCGECLSCIKYGKLVHPDLHFVYPIALSKDVRTSTAVIVKWREAFLENPYLNINDWFDYLDAENKQPIIGAEESADILHKLSFTTYESEYKIMIIWLPEKLNHQAANKLLKILEEPPEKTLFLLVSDNEEQLLRTIVSRTQLIKINKLSDEELQKALIEKKALTKEEALAVLRLADGSFNTALKLLRHDDGESLNLSLFQLWMRACLKFDAPKVLAWVEQISKTGRENQKNFFTYSLSIIRECLMYNYGDKILVKVDPQEADFIQKFARFVHSDNCELFVNELNLAQQHIERNANPKILFLDLSFKMNELLNLPVAEKV